MKKATIAIATTLLVFVIFIAGCVKQPTREIVRQPDYRPSTTIPSQQAIAQQSSPQAVDATIDAQLSQLIDQETDLAQLERELVI
jgi:ABC-type transporter MlaC component